MTEAEFRGFTPAETLRAALIQRHTFDPLASFQERVDTDLLSSRISPAPIGLRRRRDMLPAFPQRGFSRD
jgi:hypothetical protein